MSRYDPLGSDEEERRGEAAEGFGLAIAILVLLALVFWLTA